MRDSPSLVQSIENTEGHSPCCLLLHRYYAQQRTADAISSNMVKDELKRHTRMNKQLAEEQRVLEELYKVSTPLTHDPAHFQSLCC